MNWNRPVRIIAEAGVNHCGSLQTAIEMVRTAKQCGADIVKFQTAKLDSLVSETAEMADYQKKNLGSNVSQKDMLRNLILPFEDFRKLAASCKETGIQFLSTPFDIDSVRFLNPMQELWKIPSGEITNYPYLVEIAKTGKSVILSTGMSTLDEIHDAMNVLKEYGTTDITLLHCTTEYPASMRDVNLNAMHTLREAFGCPVGYSDHTEGIEASIAVAAMGAVVIEKHFTLDRTMKGPDHKASIEPDALKDLVRSVRNIELAMGSFHKAPTEAELKNRTAARKSIVASRFIRKGESFGEDNLTAKRPGSGISPMRWNEVIGRTACRDFRKDELIEL